MSTANQELVRRFIDQVWNQQQLDAVEQFVAADYAVYVQGNPEPWRGPDVVRRAVTGFRSGFPDWQDTIDDLFGEGDRVAVRWTSGGTHQAAFAGIEPTGRRFTLSGVDIYRVAGGKITEHWSFADIAGFIQRLRDAVAASATEPAS